MKLRTASIIGKTIIAIFAVFVFTSIQNHIGSRLISAEETSMQTATGYTVVDTGQVKHYNNLASMDAPDTGEAFFGQDAYYKGNTPSYQDNGDGTITDLNTGLMWQKSVGEKVTFDEAVAGVSSFNLAGYNDWRLPTIKELYSLILFSGEDISSWTVIENAIPFIDTQYFDFEYGDPSIGERYIDAQYISSTKYVDTTMGGMETAFGVNFADGRIKGYGYGRNNRGYEKEFFVKYVRGNTSYGNNQLVDNGDGTITDFATGLMWMKSDSGHLKAGNASDGKLNWQQALDWAENLTYANYSDWRLPNAKELQSIVDYTRSPATTNSAAIDPLFNVSSIINGNNQTDYPYYWTSTTHSSGGNIGATAVYISFGRALGWMQDFSGIYQLMDVHGAGAQRCDPKVGNPDDYPYGRGPQGDVIYIYNFARCVRDVDTDSSSTSLLTVNSSPDSGASITVSPIDNNNNGDGQTNFTRLYDTGSNVSLTAAAIHNGKNFSKWIVNGIEYLTPDINFDINNNTTVTVYYDSNQSGTPIIRLNKRRIHFRIFGDGSFSPSQQLIIRNIGDGEMNWNISTDASWLKITPNNGVDIGVIDISIKENPTGKGFNVGWLTVSDSNALNSPQYVQVMLMDSN